MTTSAPQMNLDNHFSTLGGGGILQVFVIIALKELTPAEDDGAIYQCTKAWPGTSSITSIAKLINNEKTNWKIMAKLEHSSLASLQ